MASKVVSQLDRNGVYVGPAEAQESPLEPGVYLIPSGCVDSIPPSHVDGMNRVFSNGWKYVPIETAPAVVEPVS